MADLATYAKLFPEAWAYAVQVIEYARDKNLPMRTGGDLARAADMMEIDNAPCEQFPLS